MGKIPYAEGKPSNFDRPMIKVKHSDLKRVGEDTLRSCCSVCNKGILLLQRDIRTFKLSRTDRCISCGQSFYYSDETIDGQELV